MKTHKKLTALLAILGLYHPTAGPLASTPPLVTNEHSQSIIDLMDTPIQKYVLIVEDDSVLAGMLRQSLEAAGFKSAIAKNGEEGHATATTGTPPDFMVVDIDMPKMDGVTMLKMLRAEGVTVPAIMLTNFSQPEHVADAAEIGVLEYLVKADWEIDQIVEKVKLHLTSKQTA